jgi:hypothetical protein
MKNIFENINDEFDLTYTINKEYKIEKYIIKEMIPIIRDKIKHNMINTSNINELRNNISTEIDFYIKNMFYNLNKNHQEYILDILTTKFIKK